MYFIRCIGTLFVLSGMVPACVWGQQDAVLPEVLIDTHIHLYDPSRPEGVPWPPADSPLSRPRRGSAFKRVGKPAGVTGAIVVEASPWLEDNQWVLDLIDGDPFFLGLIGNLDIGTEVFADQLARFSANPRFRGIRLKELPQEALDEARLADLRRLAGRGLVAEVQLAGMSLDDVLALADAVPALPLLVNHLGGIQVDGKAPPLAWQEDIEALAQKPNVYMKISGLFQQSGQDIAPTEMVFYAPVLDVLWQAFGAERLIYGSNWPVSDLRGEYQAQQTLVLTYLATKDPTAPAKVMGHNALVFYGFLPSPTAVYESTNPVPQDFFLAQNYPNPFNGETLIRFALPHAGSVDVRLYDLAGQQVATLLTGSRAAGSYTVRWDGRGAQGQLLASGVYIYRLRFAGITAAYKLILLQ